MDDAGRRATWTGRFADAAKRHWAPIVGLLIVAAAPFVHAAMRGETPFFLDLQDHWFPIRLAAWRARRSGELAQWCGNLFCGIPLLAQVEAGFAYPLHFVSDLIHPAYTLLPQIVLHRFVAGALTYAALRLRGFGRTASFFGGAALVTCGFTTNALSQLAVLRTIAWLPTLLIASHFLTRGRLLVGALWTAAGAGLVLVAGYAPYLQRAGLLVPFLLLGDPAFPRNASELRARAAAAAAACVGLALGAALAAAQLVPSLALSAESQRALGLDPAFADGLRATPADLAMILVPRFTVDGGVVRQGFAYLGMIPICLAAFAVVRRRPGAAAFAAAALFAVVAALGTQTPLGDLLLRLPMASSFRNPTQYLAVWWLSVPVLAAMGIDAWIERRPDARETAIAVGAPAAILVLAAFVPSFPADGATRLRLGVAVAALVAALVAARLPTRAAVALLVTVAVADAASMSLRYADKEGRTRPISRVAEPDAPLARVAAYHAASGRDGRARVITSDRYFNWDNHVVAADVDDVRGLMSLVPLSALDLSRIVAEGAPFERRPTPEPLYDYGPTRALGSPLLDLLALRYAVGYPDSPGAGWRRIGPEEWERDAVPEARLVPRAIVVPPGSEGWRRLVEPSFSPRTTAVVESDAPLPSAGDDAGAVRFVARGPNTARMDVDARRDAVLLWSQTRDEGWSARIDGSAATILRANHAHMALVVPAGRHDVDWRYEAPGRRAGLRISFAALVVFAGLTCVAWVRRRAA